jgi:hypothetical protein
VRCVGCCGAQGLVGERALCGQGCAGDRHQCLVPCVAAPVQRATGPLAARVRSGAALRLKGREEERSKIPSGGGDTCHVRSEEEALAQVGCGRPSSAVQKKTRVVCATQDLQNAIHSQLVLVQGMQAVRRMCLASWAAASAGVRVLGDVCCLPGQLALDLVTVGVVVGTGGRLVQRPRCSEHARLYPEPQ